MTKVEAANEPRPRRHRLRHIGRLILLVGGLALLAWLVHAAGTARVIATLTSAGRWVPLLVALEIGAALFEVWALRLFAGTAANGASGRLWLRATALAYVSMVLLPAGRLAGEAARATLLAPSIGAACATASSTRLQASALFGNACVSLAAFAALSSNAEQSRPLLVGLALNTVACVAAGIFLLVLLESARVRRALAKFPRFAELSQRSAMPGATGRFLPATALCVLARALQSAEYAVIVAAVGGAFGLRLGLLGQGIHLVGAAAGDLIPGQLGAMEGVYRWFAPALGFAGMPAQALSIPLLARLVQLVGVLLLLPLFALLPTAPRAEHAP